MVHIVNLSHYSHNDVIMTPSINNIHFIFVNTLNGFSVTLHLQAYLFFLINNTKAE